MYNTSPLMRLGVMESRPTTPRFLLKPVPFQSLQKLSSCRAARKNFLKLHGPMSNTIVISASYDRKILFWNVACRRIVRSVSFEDSQVNCMHLCMDNRYLVVGGSSVIRVYDLESDSPLDTVGYPTIVPVSKFDSGSGAMSFTSIGSFRLRREACDSSAIGLDESVIDLYAMTCIGLHPSVDADINLVLYATSEDGYIRFFDGRFSGSLRVLKTIRTGAAITCSALSPDNRFLLTGSQIGQVSVWHLPSVIGSISIDSKRANVNAGSRSQLAVSQMSANSVNPADGEKDAQDRLDTTVFFGSRPLQTISFENDYSAVRSVAMSATGWWGVAATHCGYLHFICLSEFASIPTRESPKPRTTNDGDEASSVAADATEKAPVSDAAGMTPGPKGVHEDPAAQRIRLSTYASALEANNQRSTARHLSDVENGTMSSSTASPGAFGTSTRSGPNEGISAPAADAAEEKLLASRKSPGPTSSSSCAKKTSLQKELEMKVFHSFQAHYKYILKVALAPNNGLLVTCSADYSVGRFLVPKSLLEWRMNSATANKSSRPPSVMSVTGVGQPRDGLAAGMGGIVLGADEEGGQGVATETASLNSLRSAPADGGADVEGVEKDLTEPKQPTSPNHETHADPLDLTNAPSSNRNETSSTMPETVENLPKSAEPAESGTTGALNTIHFKPLKPLTGHARWVWDCAFSACSSFLFTGSSDSSIRMWDGVAENESCPSTPFAEGHKKPVIVLLLYLEKRKNTAAQLFKPRDLVQCTERIPGGMRKPQKRGIRHLTTPIRLIDGVTLVSGEKLSKEKRSKKMIRGNFPRNQP
eukprot:gene4063-2913_t